MLARGNKRSQKAGSLRLSRQNKSREIFLELKRMARRNLDEVAYMKTPEKLYGIPGSPTVTAAKRFLDYARMQTTEDMYRAVFELQVVLPRSCPTSRHGKHE